MNGRKALSLALAGIAVMSLAFGTGAFTSVSAERGVSVSVVDDDSAYVGYNTSNMTVSDGDRVELVTLQNRLNGKLEVTDVDIAADSTSFSDLSYPTMGSGQSGAIEGDVACEGGTTETIQVTVTVSGTGMWAKIFGDSETQQRAFEVTCEAPEEQASINNVTYKGGGNLVFETTAVSTTNVSYWTTDANANSDTVAVHGPTNVTDVDLTTSFQPQINENEHVIAVYFPEYDVTYYHPTYNVENESVGSWSGGSGHKYNGGPDFDN